MLGFVAEELLKYTKEELAEVLTGQFALEFSDGVIQTNADETIYTLNLWEFIRMHPIPLKKAYHVADYMSRKMLGKNSHMEIVNNMIWDAYEIYREGDAIDKALIDRLTYDAYETANLHYNDLVVRYSTRLMPVSFLDIAELFDVEEVDEILSKTKPNERSILATNRALDKLFKTSTNPKIARNRYVMMARAGLVKMNQLVQQFGPSGYIEDINTDIFPVPLMSNYTDGHRSLYDNEVESRKATQAHNATKAELEDAVYQSRGQGFVNSAVARINPGDCHTNEYLIHRLQDTKDNGLLKSDVFLMQGKHVALVSKPDEWFELTADRVDLIGELVYIRTITHCADHDPNGVCEKCYGAMALTLPERTNPGALTTQNLYAYIIQRQLSKKHYLGNSVVQKVQIFGDDQKFLRVGEDGISYYLVENPEVTKMKLVISGKDGKNITDVLHLDNVETVNIARITEVGSITLKMDKLMKMGKGSAVIGDKRSFILGTKKRLASFSHAFLAHVKKMYWEVDANNNFVVDMTGWDFNQPLAHVPKRNASLIDFSDAYKDHLDSTVKLAEQRAVRTDPDEFLMETYKLVNEEMEVNFSQIETVVYGAMIRSMEENDYALPKPWSKKGIGVLSTTMAMRSLAAPMAYEQQLAIFNNLKSFVVTNRLDHPYDAVFMPAEVLNRRKRR